MERIQKILARGGIASRRAAEQLITAGRVRVNGRIVTELGAKANPRKDRVEVDGKRVVAEQSVYVVLHKPRGVVSTMSDPEGRPTVRELLKEVGGRVFPIGRLDFATSGILICTNDGEMSDGLLHPRKAVPKTYAVKVKGVMTPDDLDVWRNGVQLEDGVTLPAEAKMIRHEGDKTWIELTIREGRNQQIRRMGEATRFPVMRLARVAFAGIDLEGLPPGRWRAMTRDELMQLKKTYGVPRSLPAATPLVQSPGGAKRTRPAGAPARGRSSGDARQERGDARGRSADSRDSREDRGSARGRSAEPREERSHTRDGGRSNTREGARSSSREGARGNARGGGRGNAWGGGGGRGVGAGGAGPDSRDGGRQGGRGSESGRGRSRGASETPRSGDAPRTQGARYGGGAPGRRNPETKDDWGGGAGRGSSRRGDDRGSGGRGSEGRGSDERNDSHSHGGRMGRTRTTGTGGGIGARGPTDRVKGRRGR